MNTSRSSLRREAAVLLVASSLAPTEQASARTLAAIVLAAFALFGALVLILPRRADEQCECACEPSPNT